ncbi:Dus-domain-containing protein [Basidiobolus meristosporus CBS 931.73]|uniref:tRNA-dihydrouridine(16/17) synthase [NAD(P)(+)] n=1 Tax=Basidiobolus meristosporus CBS 931.73 TaxID=1314790 RepID=A0A1Y1XVJ0_9FUNG|nr:Dus-domain-containing protein [Basidiobolus meristosporus CBS 931.73]|eukprot:ORX89782.1 Dus-domain-containing protein [Basidiobolus meristosporus CBS 931.73]
MTIQKPTGFEFWEKSLKSAKYVVAPMVDQSEEAWRVLSRRYGADLCYTPMFHARLFSESQHYRDEQFTTSPQDRPLVVQFCANDPETLLKAALLVQDKCDAVDLNIGCPQHIAKRGHYGSFLMEDWDLLKRMVSLLHKELSIPVTCKIRIFPDVNKTIEYAKMLVDAGAQLLTVHGRLREQKGHKTGLADWEQIKLVREAVSVPVFANGNILYHEDVQKCLDYTGANGVMSAEGNLYNPALFSGKLLPVWQMAQEYLDICKEIPTKTHMIRPHLFKIFRPCLHIHTDMREQLGKVKTIEEFEKIVQELKRRLEETAKNTPSEITTNEDGTLNIPHWLCQPYFRPPLPEPKSEPTVKAPEAANEDDQSLKRKPLDNESPKKNPKPKKIREGLCSHCKNVASVKCPFQSCKQCCRKNETCHQCETHNYKKSKSAKITEATSNGDEEPTAATAAAV